VVAAKTGTTQNFRDAWTVGYTPAIAVAVWAGNNDNRPMRAGADGVFVAAPLWREFIDTALERFPETGFIAYTPRMGERRSIRNALSSGRTIYVDKRTGKQISKEKAAGMKKKNVEKFTEPPEAVSEEMITLSEDQLADYAGIRS
jgi:membrane carboxypeptidase/penicillin-binding protein